MTCALRAWWRQSDSAVGDADAGGEYVGCAREQFRHDGGRGRRDRCGEDLLPPQGGDAGDVRVAKVVPLRLRSPPPTLTEHLHSGALICGKVLENRGT